MFLRRVIIDCCSVLLGRNLDCMIKHYVPDRIKQQKNVTFGIEIITIRIRSMSKISLLFSVILAFILDGLVGVLLDFDNKIKTILYPMIKKLNFKLNENQEEYMRFYPLVTVIFCAISEGISGDFSILL